MKKSGWLYRYLQLWDPAPEWSIFNACDLWLAILLYAPVSFLRTLVIRALQLGLIVAIAIAFLVLPFVAIHEYSPDPNYIPSTLALIGSICGALEIFFVIVYFVYFFIDLGRTWDYTTYFVGQFIPNTTRIWFSKVQRGISKWRDECKTIKWED